MENFTWYVVHECFQSNVLGHAIKAHLHACKEAQRENGCWGKVKIWGGGCVCLLTSRLWILSSRVQRRMRLLVMSVFMQVLCVFYCGLCGCPVYVYICFVYRCCMCGLCACAYCEYIISLTTDRAWGHGAEAALPLSAVWSSMIHFPLTKCSSKILPTWSKALKDSR